MRSLVGETLVSIDVSDDSILLKTESGREILLEHRQDCCESVGILDTNGEWKNLIGRPLLEFSHDEDDWPEASESGTLTTFTFRVNDATVINRWVGESNGYYSESVDLREITR